MKIDGCLSIGTNTISATIKEKISIFLTIQLLKSHFFESKNRMKQKYLF